MLGRYPVRIDIPVQWGDMDAFRHVNNAMYLRWFESARIAYFERIGLVRYDAVGPILARATIDFRSAVRYPDVVTIEATVATLGNTSFEMRYRATSGNGKGALVAEGESVIVLYDYTASRKVRLPDDLREAITALEGDGHE